MTNKYLDLTGLAHLVDKIKALIKVTGVKGNAESAYRTGNVNLTPGNIGAVNKAGDTLTGTLNARGGQYHEGNNGSGINMNNSDITGLNSLYFNDASDNGKEGINFYHDATHFDSLYAKSGKLYFTPNRLTGAATSDQGNLEVYTPPNYQNGTSDIVMQSRVNQTRANRLAYLPADQIIVEKTIDGGSTWQDAGVNDTVKRQVFSGVMAGNIVLPRTADNKKSENCGLRFTITGMKYNVPAGTAETEKYNYWNPDYVKSTERYCGLQFFWFWLGANSDTLRIKIERQTGAQAKTNTWTTIFDEDWGATGWPGSDWVKVPYGTFGGGTTQTGNYWNWRISFFSRIPDGKTAFVSNNTQNVYRVYGYGESIWTTPNTLAGRDDIYTLDLDKNATFPAGVTATGGFTGNLTGTASKATNDSDGNPINTTYLKKADYIAATAAPGKVASASSAGTSTNYARQDHTHGIDLATGDANGQVKIAGMNVSVKGLAALAYKDSLSKSDVGLENVDNTADANKSVSHADTAGDADTVNGLTVLTAVPANAQFTDTIPSAYCTTAAATAAKTASFTNYSLSPNSYFMMVVKTANTAKSKLTLNVNSKGAKDIWINGSVSSASNYSFAAGSHLVYYDGSVYHIRTDGKIPGYEHVENKSSATIRGELTQANVVNALGYTPSSGASYEEMTVTEALMGDSTVARAISAATLRTVLQSALHVQSYTVTTVANNFVSPYKAFARIDISTALGDYPTIISAYVESPSADKPAMVSVSGTEYATLYLYSMTAAEFDVVVVLAAIYV